jgi:hypothetical protein
MKETKLEITISDEFHNQLFELRQFMKECSFNEKGTSMNDFFIACLIEGYNSFNIRVWNNDRPKNKIQNSLIELDKIYPWFTEMMDVRMTFNEFQLYIESSAIHKIKEDYKKWEEGKLGDDVYMKFWLGQRKEILEANGILYYELMPLSNNNFLTEDNLNESPNNKEGNENL